MAKVPVIKTSCIIRSRPLKEESISFTTKNQSRNKTFDQIRFIISSRHALGSRRHHFQILPFEKESQALALQPQINLGKMFSNRFNSWRHPLGSRKHKPHLLQKNCCPYGKTLYRTFFGLKSCLLFRAQHLTELGQKMYSGFSSLEAESEIVPYIVVVIFTFCDRENLPS